MSKDDFPIGATPPRARIALEEKLGHVFARPELLDLALTHSSWANEYSGGQHHNERQEFLGDAVLELCVSWELFRRFPEAREGELTKLRARLVSTVSLAERAREFGLDSLLKLGKGEERQGGRSRDSVLSDVLEAVLAAVYEDGGFTPRRRRWPTSSRRIGRERPGNRRGRIIRHACRKWRSNYSGSGRCTCNWQAMARNTPKFLKFPCICRTAENSRPAAQAAKKPSRKPPAKP